MKRITLFLLIAICLQTFCLLPQLSFAQSDRGVKSLSGADLRDSDQYWRTAMQLPKPRPDNSKRIEALLKQMTLEEKVGQMTQLTLGMIVSGRDQDIKIDPVKLEKAVGKYGVGSFLNVSDQALSVDKWHEIIGEIQKASAKTRTTPYSALKLRSCSTGFI